MKIKIKVKIIDIGNEYFIKKCEGFIFVPHITEKSSLKKINKFKNFITDNLNEDNPILLIVKKSDLKKDITENELIEFCNKLNIKIYIESSKNFNNNNFKNNIETIIQESAILVNNKKDNIGNIFYLKEEKKNNKKSCFN